VHLIGVISLSGLLFIYASGNVHVCHLRCNNFYLGASATRCQLPHKSNGKVYTKVYVDSNNLAPVFSLATNVEGENRGVGGARRDEKEEAMLIDLRLPLGK